MTHLEIIKSIESIKMEDTPENKSIGSNKMDDPPGNKWIESMKMDDTPWNKSIESKKKIADIPASSLMMMMTTSLSAA